MKITRVLIAVIAVFAVPLTAMRPLWSASAHASGGGLSLGLSENTDDEEKLRIEEKMTATGADTDGQDDIGEDTEDDTEQEPQIDPTPDGRSLSNEAEGKDAVDPVRDTGTRALRASTVSVIQSAGVEKGNCAPPVSWYEAYEMIVVNIVFSGSEF